jgi:hypothetical protein
MKNIHKKLEEARGRIGETVLYKLKQTKLEEPPMIFNCRIVDVKMAYGRLFYKLVPISGSGSKWTDKEVVVDDGMGLE